MKDQDPIAFNIAEGEYIDSLLQDEQIVTFDNMSFHVMLTYKGYKGYNQLSFQIGLH